MKTARNQGSMGWTPVAGIEPAGDLIKPDRALMIIAARNRTGDCRRPANAGVMMKALFIHGSTGPTPVTGMKPAIDPIQPIRWRLVIIVCILIVDFSRTGIGGGFQKIVLTGRAMRTVPVTGAVMIPDLIYGLSSVASIPIKITCVCYRL